MKEKDLNYIAALERAIKKKYGQEAIENPAKFWDEKKEESYLKQLKQFVEKLRSSEPDSARENVNGVLITKKLLNRERKLNCPVCKSLMRKINDDVYLLKYDCCEACYVKYVENREDRWLEGWRPKNVPESS